MWIKAKLIVAAAAVVLVAGLGLWVVALRADRARLGAELTQSRTEVQGLQREAAANVAALARREAERARLTVEMAALKGELKELYEQNEETRAWAAGLVPDAICHKLR